MQRGKLTEEHPHAVSIDESANKGDHDDGNHTLEGRVVTGRQGGGASSLSLDVGKVTAVHADHGCLEDLYIMSKSSRLSDSRSPQNM